MMRSLLSYFFLITLLFPSVVETIHAIEDSHDLCEDTTTHFCKEIQTCDLALYFSIDFDNSSDDFNLSQDFNYSIENNSMTQNLISNRTSSDIKYRGPPIT